MVKKSPTRQTKEKAHKFAVSKSGLAVAAALSKHFPTQAEEIVRVMEAAATSRGMRRKLQRVALSLESLAQGGGR